MKVAVVGLDGVGWPVLNKLFEYDAMPFFKKISENSVRGILKSTVPPNTPPAWTSITTGVNPGKHGVFDFVIPTKNHGTRIVNALDVKYPRIHEMVALKHLRSICINLPLTYPITLKSENCMTISDWIAPRVTYYPKFLKNYISEYPSHVPLSHYKSKDELLKGLCAEAEAKTKVTCALMENIDWDLFWIVYSESDHMLHRCYEEIYNGKGESLKPFRAMDQTIKKASKIADLTIVVSDHGFSKFQYFININSFLNKLGLVTKTWKKTMKEFTDFEIERAREPTIERRKIPENLYKIASAKPIKMIVKKIYKFFTGKDIRAELPYADPAKSKAFMSSHGSHGIHVRDQSVIEHVIEELRKLKGIYNVWRREEIYHGLFTTKAPEILLLPDYDHGYGIGTIMLHPKVITEKTECWHHPDGVIAMFGKGITPAWVENVETFDVVPTILRYMGLPLPRDTDGTPISNIEYPRKNVKRYDYLKHWQLVRRIQVKKAAFTKRLKIETF